MNFLVFALRNKQHMAEGRGGRQRTSRGRLTALGAAAARRGARARGARRGARGAAASAPAPRSARPPRTRSATDTYAQLPCRGGGPLRYNGSI